MAIKLSNSVAVLTIFAGLLVFGSCQVSHPLRKTLCVNTLENNIFNCSALKLKFNCTVCQPLSSYIQDVNQYFTNNTEMVFTEGTHCLRPPSNITAVINVTGIFNFTMKGLGTVSYNSKEEGATQPSSVISCNCSSPDKSGIFFYKSNSIHIENLTIECCGANFTLQRPHKFPLISALTFYESRDIKLYCMRMDRSLGFGLHVDRVFGNVTVSHSAFLRSNMSDKNHSSFSGNVMFRNSNCNSTLHAQYSTTIYIEYSWFLRGKKRWNNWSLTAAGLTLFIHLPNTRVFIHNITVYNNTGNVAITIIDYHDNMSSVNISNSTISHGYGLRGSGLRVKVQIWKNEVDNSAGNMKKGDNIVTVFNTIFYRNLAIENGAGVYITHFEQSIDNSVYRNIRFRACRFIGNSILYSGKSHTGAAVQVLKHKMTDIVPHTSPQIFVIFTNCTFLYNKIKGVKNEGGILDFVSTNGILIVDSNFTSNEGTAISLRDSNVHFYGHIIFKNNTAMHGGALKLCQLSKMYLTVGHVQIHFIDNTATSMGGAIYIAQEQCVETSPPCFFQLIAHKNITLNDLNFILLFQNNSAILAGNAVYGGLIDQCYLMRDFSFKDGKIHPFWSQTIFNKLFNLIKQSNASASTLSSTPYGVCFCNNSYEILDSLTCENTTYPQTVIPGQAISLGVTAVGQRNGTIPISSVYFNFNNTEKNSNSSQIVVSTAQGNQQRTRCNILNFRVYSNETTADFTLSLEQASLSMIRFVQYKSPHLKMHIGKCPWAFTLRTSPPYACICDSLLMKFGISCTVDTETVSRPGGRFYWLGCSSYFGGDDNINNETGQQPYTCSGVKLATQCFPGYCKTESVNISAETLDKQCSEGRQGVLCSQCKPRHGLALGTSRCLPNCSSYGLYIVIIAVCAASALLLILFLITCNFTANEGTVNGLLFYAHIVHRNHNSFFPGSAGTSNANVFRLFIAWLNLDFGYEVCFYRSLTQYQNIWIQFGFLSYVLILEFFIVTLSHRYVFITRLVGRNVVKVLATLFLITYAKSLNIAISSLEFAIIKQSSDSHSIVWLFDGELTYLSRKHIPLFILGTTLTLILLAYTLILLFIQCLQKRSNVWCLRWVERFRPFFEAYTGPCHVHYRFWPGFLFFVRMTLFLFSALLRDQPKLNLHITTAACIVILVFAFVSPNGVYKKWPQNILEISFVVNLGIISGLVAIFSYSQSSGTFEASASYFVYPSVALVMFLFACILLLHCIKQLSSCRHCRKVLQLVAARKRMMNMNTIQEVYNKEEIQPFLNQYNVPNVVCFDDYREPLIED